MNFLLALYSQGDEQFVEGEMAEFLEELGFKICCHRKDFNLGVLIEQNIEDATVHSRRMICVISRCCIIGQQTNVDWNALVSLVLNETNTDVRMYS